MTPKAIKFQGLWLILPITVTEHVTENNFEEKKKNFGSQFKKRLSSSWQESNAVKL